MRACKTSHAATCVRPSRVVIKAGTAVMTKTGFAHDFWTKVTMHWIWQLIDVCIP